MCRHLDSAFVANRCRRNARCIRSKRICRFEMPRPVPLISPSVARSYRRLRRRGIVENHTLQVLFRDIPRIAFSSEYRRYRTNRTRTQGRIMASSCVVLVCVRICRLWRRPPEFRRFSLHRGDYPAKVVDLLPIRKLDDCLWIGRPFGHPHDESDDLAIPECVYRIVKFPGKDR